MVLKVRASTLLWDTAFLWSLFLQVLLKQYRSKILLIASWELHHFLANKENFFMVFHLFKSLSTEEGHIPCYNQFIFTVCCMLNEHLVDSATTSSNIICWQPNSMNRQLVSSCGRSQLVVRSIDSETGERTLNNNVTSRDQPVKSVKVALWLHSLTDMMQSRRLRQTDNNFWTAKWNTHANMLLYKCCVVYRELYLPL